MRSQRGEIERTIQRRRSRGRRAAIEWGKLAVMIYLKFAGK
jgi:hypothetical protein